MSCGSSQESVAFARNFQTAPGGRETVDLLMITLAVSRAMSGGGRPRCHPVGLALLSKGASG